MKIRPLAHTYTAQGATEFIVLTQPCSNPRTHDVSDPARRLFMRGGVAFAAGGLFSGLAGCTTDWAAKTVESLALSTCIFQGG
jgi:hypothetical protein